MLIDVTGFLCQPICSVSSDFTFLSFPSFPSEILVNVSFMSLQISLGYKLFASQTSSNCKKRLLVSMLNSNASSEFSNLDMSNFGVNLVLGFFSISFLIWLPQECDLCRSLFHVLFLH